MPTNFKGGTKNMVKGTRKTPKLRRPTQNKFPGLSKEIAPKINTNLREGSDFSEYPDVKFEPFTWSNSTTLQAGFFTLPKISNHFSQSPSVRTQKERSFSYNSRHETNYCEKIDEVPDSYTRPLKKFSKVSSPWKFQLSTFITPSDS